MGSASSQPSGRKESLDSTPGSVTSGGFSTQVPLSYVGQQIMAYGSFAYFLGYLPLVASALMQYYESQLAGGLMFLSAVLQTGGELAWHRRT